MVNCLYVKLHTSTTDQCKINFRERKLKLKPWGVLAVGHMISNNKQIFMFSVLISCDA